MFTNPTILSYLVAARIDDTLRQRHVAPRSSQRGFSLAAPLLAKLRSLPLALLHHGSPQATGLR